VTATLVVLTGRGVRVTLETGAAEAGATLAANGAALQQSLRACRPRTRYRNGQRRWKKTGEQAAAIALAYDDKDRAPTVVAKGRGMVAEANHRRRSARSGVYVPRIAAAGRGC
jgi:hypothetical protein